MSITLTTDMLLGIGALIVASGAVYMFIRATDGVSKSTNEPQKQEPSTSKVDPDIKVPDMPMVTKKSEVTKSKTLIRTLTLQQEILGMVMRRLFEAEDEGEINKDERMRLSKNYEAELSKVTDELNKAELIVSLNELEEIRSTIVQQFQETLSDTQSKIDLIIKELDIQPVEPEPVEKPIKKTKPKPVKPKKKTEKPKKKKKESVEDRLDKLKQDVLKELEELDRLELEQ